MTLGQSEPSLQPKVETIHAGRWINVILITGIVATLTIYLFMIRPQAEELTLLSAQSNELDSTRAIYEQKPKPPIAEDTEIKTLLEETPTDEDWGTFFADLHDVIEQVGVNVEHFDLALDATEFNKSLSKAKDDQELTFQSLPFTMTVHGTYGQVTNFMNKLQQMKRIVQVNNWDIGVLPDQVKNTGSQNVQMNLRAIIYQAGKYKDVFSRFSKQKEMSVESRQDPTIGDAGFYEKLVPQSNTR